MNQETSPHMEKKKSMMKILIQVSVLIFFLLLVGSARTDTNNHGDNGNGAKTEYEPFNIQGEIDAVAHRDTVSLPGEKHSTNTGLEKENRNGEKGTTENRKVVQTQIIGIVSFFVLFFLIILILKRKKFFKREKVKQVVFKKAGRNLSLFCTAVITLILYTIAFHSILIERSAVGISLSSCVIARTATMILLIMLPSSFFFFIILRFTKLWKNIEIPYVLFFVIATVLMIYTLATHQIEVYPFGHIAPTLESNMLELLLFWIIPHVMILIYFKKRRFALMGSNVYFVLLIPLGLIYFFSFPVAYQWLPLQISSYDSILYYSIFESEYFSPLSGGYLLILLFLYILVFVVFSFREYKFKRPTMKMALSMFVIALIVNSFMFSSILVYINHQPGKAIELWESETLMGKSTDSLSEEEIEKIIIKEYTKESVTIDSITEAFGGRLHEYTKIYTWHQKIYQINDLNSDIQDILSVKSSYFPPKTILDEVNKLAGIGDRIRKQKIVWYIFDDFLKIYGEYLNTSIENWESKGNTLTGDWWDRFLVSDEYLEFQKKIERELDPILVEETYSSIMRTEGLFCKKTPFFSYRFFFDYYDHPNHFKTLMSKRYQRYHNYNNPSDLPAIFDVYVLLIMNEFNRLYTSSNTYTNTLLIESMEPWDEVFFQETVPSINLGLILLLSYLFLISASFFMAYQASFIIDSYISKRQFLEIYPNPYIAGNPIRSKEMFFGRKDVFEFIKDKLDVTENITIVLHGQRRTGKTSVLYQIENGKLGEKCVPVYIDIQEMAKVDEREFFVKITEKIIESLKKIEIVKSTSNNYLEINNILDEYQKKSNHYQTFGKFLDKVSHLLREKYLLLMFDEYETLEEKIKSGNLSPDLIQYMRSQMQHREKFSFIFTGSKKLEELKGKYWSLMFNVATYKKISFLEKKDALDLMKVPVKSKIHYDNEAIDKLLRLTAGHPYFLQLFMQNLVDHVNDIKKSKVRVEEISHVLNYILDNPPPHMHYVWQDSTDEQKLILSALSEIIESEKEYISVKKVEEHLITNKMTPDTTSINQGLDKLYKKEILDCRNREYNFKIDLLRYWIKTEHPLFRTMEEIQ